MGPPIRARTAVGRQRPSAASRGSFAWACATALAAVLPACALNQEGVQPPNNEIFYPGSALIDPGGKLLYVANSNSDLRYNNGTLVVVNLDAAHQDYLMADPPWPPCPAVNYIRPNDATDATPLCCWDYLDHQVLNCDSRTYVEADSTVRIGSFAAAMIRRPTATASQLLIAVRGNTSVTSVDVAEDGDKRTFTCTDGGPTPFAECDA